jgi:thiamine transport system substrate-binding protein
VAVRSTASLILLTLSSITLSACSLVGGSDTSETGESGGSGGSGEVVLVTHDSFVMSEELVAAFESASGYTLRIKPSGDAGLLTNKLVLSQGDPLGDVVFGIDNTFASRAIEENVLAPYAADLPEGAENDLVAGDEEQHLTPVDNGNVCVNIDTTFLGEAVAPPETLRDLTRPEFEDLLVTPAPTTSSPGLAFLLATIDEFGDDGWQDYWRDLLDNGAEVVPGWTDAYQVRFTQGGGEGDRPIVVSYDSSPAFTLDGEGGTTTRALLDTCYRQVEYAGVLAGADNPEGARALVDFMLGEEFQAALPEAMYVFPVDSSVDLPEDWARFAERPTTAYAVDPAEIAANRERWLTEWSQLVG